MVKTRNYKLICLNLIFQPPPPPKKRALMKTVSDKHFFEFQPQNLTTCIFILQIFMHFKISRILHAILTGV